MLSSRRRAVEVFAGFGYQAMTSKRRECMKRQVSGVWPSLKDGPRATPMWFSAKRYQVKKTESPNTPTGPRPDVRWGYQAESLTFGKNKPALPGQRRADIRVGR